jgi:hypothetical protein
MAGNAGKNLLGTSILSVMILTAGAALAAECTQKSLDRSLAKKSKFFDRYNAGIDFFNETCTGTTSRRVRIENMDHSAMSRSLLASGNERDQIRKEHLDSLEKEVSLLDKDSKVAESHTNGFASMVREIGSVGNDLRRSGKSCPAKQNRDVFYAQAEDMERLIPELKDIGKRLEGCSATLARLHSNTRLQLADSKAMFGGKSGKMSQFGMIEQLHKDGDEKASVRYAQYFIEGTETEQDIERAIEILSSPHLKGNFSAHLKLSEIYLFKKDKKKTANRELGYFHSLIFINDLGHVMRSSEHGSVYTIAEEGVPEDRRDVVKLRVRDWLQENDIEIKFRPLKEL